MNRKLRNSRNALLLTATACISGALAVAAVPLEGAPAPASIDPVEVLLVETGAAVEAPVRKAARHTHMRRLTAMPYFSFVPRG